MPVPPFPHALRKTRPFRSFDPARTGRRSVPIWLIHPLGWRSAPVPWTAMLRGALGAGPLLALGVLTEHVGQAVAAGIAAMLAGVNDRPGTRRTGVVHIGLPAAAGALGMLCGSLLADAGSRWGAVPALFVVGLLSGALSVAGPVWSAAAMQLLVATAVGAGMPLPGPAWLKAGCFLCGAAWLLLLRLFLRTPRLRRSTPGEGEREAVAEVFDALADALRALGGPEAEAARRRLTAAQQRAEEALRLMRVLSWPVRRTGRGSTRAHVLIERLGAATALCEAGISLLWEGRPLDRHVADGPRRLAAAVRDQTSPGALASPLSDTVQRDAFDRALLEAAVTFDRTTPGRTPLASSGHGASAADGRPGVAPRARRGVNLLSDHGARHEPTRPWRDVFGPAGREYGLRVALCVAVSAAVALALHETHWYWLPATAAFLVKPDMGPLFSRVVNRFAGTATGVLVFTLATAGLHGAWWPAAVVVAGGMLIPVAVRNFGFQTAVVTVLVLSFVHAAGDSEAAGARLVDTALACGIVLFVGHLPHLANPRLRVGHRFAVALRCTERYLCHVLDGSTTTDSTPVAASAGSDPADRGTRLRHAAYRALAEARVAAETAAAELPRPQHDQGHDWLAVMARAERIADAATACAVRVERGVPRPSRAEARNVTTALAAMADSLAHGRGRGCPVLTLPQAPRECHSLREVMTQLRGIHDLTTAA